MVLGDWMIWNVFLFFILEEYDRDVAGQPERSPDRALSRASRQEEEIPCVEILRDRASCQALYYWHRSPPYWRVQGVESSVRM